MRDNKLFAFFAGSAIVLSSTAAALFAGEILIRIIKPVGFALISPYTEQHPDYLFKVKSRVRARHRSFHYDARYFTDDRGLRIKNASERADLDGSAAERILCVGDSVTFGIGVNGSESFPAQLENFLRQARPDLQWQVLNAGQPGWGTSQELLWLKKEGFALKPKLIVLGFTLNDPVDDWTNGLIRMEGNRIVPVKRKIELESRMRRFTRAVPFYSFLCENSYVVTFVRKFIATAIQTGNWQYKPHPAADAAELEQRKEQWKREVALSVKIMEELVRECRVRNIPVLMSFTPWPTSMSGMRQAEDPYELIKQVYQPLKVPTLDMNRLLIQAAEKNGYQYSDLYIIGDGHLTPLGNGIVAEELSRKILALWYRSATLALPAKG